MKLAKTFLAILLAALLACGMFAVGAFAEDEIVEDEVVAEVVEEEPVEQAASDPIPADLPWFLNILQTITGINLADEFASIQDLFEFLEAFLSPGFDVDFLEDILTGEASLFDMLRAFDLGALLGELGNMGSGFLASILGGLNLGNLFGFLQDFNLSNLFGWLDFSRFFNGEFFSGFGEICGRISARIQACFASFLTFFCNFSIIGFLLRLIGLDLTLIITYPRVTG